MAATYNSRRLRLERDMDERLTREQRALAGDAGRLVLQLATVRSEAGERLVPNRRSTREQLKATIWARAVKPYFVGPGQDPFDGIEPRSPYARLLRDGIEGAVRIQAERQAALLRRVVRDRVVLDWLTGPRPLAVREQYDPFHTFVGPDGYRLSDRVWRASIEVRARIDRLLDYHIARGTPAVRIAELLEDFLTPGARLIRTRTPYGREGGYAARRLARSEITAASGRATVNASEANPFVNDIQWALSASHPCCDICDVYAAGGPAGDGVYPIAELPPYPAHPHDMCTLSPVPAGNIRDLVSELRADIKAATPRARRLQGAFNVEWLVLGLLTGALIDNTLEAAA